VLDKWLKRCYNKGIERQREVKKMTTITKNHAIREYRKYTAADGYIVCFLQGHGFYMAETEELMPRWMKMMEKSEGHDEKLQIDLKAHHKKELIRKGAVQLMTEEEFLAQKSKKAYNKGWMTEKVIFEHFGIEWDGPDKVRFDKDGDITINGKRYQIKFENAQVVTTTTIHKIQKEHQEMRKAQRMSAADEIASWLNL
jgi:hypothetical protein